MFQTLPRIALFFAGLFGAATAVAQAPVAPEPALRGHDPILLAGGKETPGRADLAVLHGGYRYLFATEAHRATFATDPEQYGIQLGGACARMGPLSGQGDPDRWLVHDGRIYVFASDACREGFQKRAALFLDADDAAPTPDAAAAAAGRRLLARAVAAIGGEDRLRALRSYQHRRAVQRETAREEYRLAVRFPATARVDQDYFQDEKVWRFHRVAGPDGGFFVGGEPVRTMHASALREARRDLLREPLFALRAAQDGKTVVAAAGPAEVAGVAVEQLELWQEGCATTFGVDAQGRIRTANYRGRGPQLWFGAVVKVYDDFRDVGGLVLPHAVTGTFDGKPAAAFAETRTGTEVDAVFAAEFFARPQ